MVAVLAVIATYGVVNPSWASAASVTGSNFEIDTNANLVVDAAPPAIDWLTGGTGTSMRAGVDVNNDLPTGQTDDAFTEGTKNNSLVPVVDTGSVPNNKSDLLAFGNYVEHNAAGTFVNVFWTRVQDPNGTTAMDFEFNQSDVNNNDWGPKPPPYYPTEIIPTRTTGDLLVTYELENGGVNPVLMRRTWLASDQWGPATTFDASQAIGSINTTAIPANQSGGLGALGARTFGEASISLAALVPNQESCITFGSVYVKSRSSHVLDEALKDFVAPVPTSISNCGSITIHKTDDDGALSGAGFTLYKDVAPTGGTSAGVEDKTLANTVDTCTTDGSGNCSFTDVKKGQYWVVETTVPAGHDGAPDQHVVITEGDQVVPLTFNNPIQHGHIVVVKNAVPDDAQDFTFSLDGSSFSLDDDDNGTLPNSRDFEVVVGTHTLSETDLPSGWVNSNLVCVDPTQDTTTAKPVATVKVAKNETVTCTYTNTYTPTAPGLSTNAVAAVANTSWNDTATLTGDGTHPVTGSVVFFVCGPTATPVGCEAGTQVGGAVQVSNGGATTSVPFTPTQAGNYCFRAEFTSSSGFYTDTSHTNATTECFLKRNANLTVSKTAVPAFGRAYTWDVDKVVVGDDSVEVPAGTTHPFDYKVTVSNTSDDSSWTVTGTITVTNPNNVAFTGVDVTDSIDNGAGSCSVPSGSDVTVPANDSVVLGYTCTYASEPSPAAGTNTATATWDSGAFFTTSFSASGTANVNFDNAEPSTTDQFVTVTDTLGGTLGTIDGATGDNPTVFTYSVPQTAPDGTCTTFPNTASVTTIRSEVDAVLIAQDVVTLDQDSASVTLCGGMPLTVDQTASGSLNREFLWLIDKSVDQTQVTNDNGQSATFTYTVTVTPNGAADSDYALSGLVTVANPNDFEDIVTDVTVTSGLGGGVTCTVVDGADATIPSGDDATFAYSCTFAGTPSLTGTVTATATWDAAAAATTVASASKAIPVTLEVGTESNRTITVTDDKTDPANPVELGTATFDDGETSFTYSLVKEGVPGTEAAAGCIDYTNVALIVETEQSDTQVVTLCHTFTGGGGGPVVNPPVVNPPQGGGLPFTGDGIGLMTREAIGLILAGLTLLIVSRKRRTA